MYQHVKMKLTLRHYNSTERKISKIKWLTKIQIILEKELILIVLMKRLPKKVGYFLRGFSEK